MQQQSRKTKQPQEPVSLLDKSKPSVSLLEKEPKTNLPDLLSQASDNLLQSLLGNPNKGDGAPLLPRKKGRRRKGMSI